MQAQGQNTIALLGTCCKKTNLSRSSCEYSLFMLLCIHAKSIMTTWEIIVYRMMNHEGQNHCRQKRQL